MRVKTSELQGAALDWAVATCENEEYCAVAQYDGIGGEYPPHRASTDWAQGGPIIERESIATRHSPKHGKWFAQIDTGSGDIMFWKRMCYRKGDFSKRVQVMFDGPTPLVAAMRCYVASKLASNSGRGDDVEVPDELL
jgi:hypothetical protein